jgi:hypothetical protein
MADATGSCSAAPNASNWKKADMFRQGTVCFAIVHFPAAACFNLAYSRSL